ncbi:MAG TPA: heme ABC transporter ATP-binding protein [Acidimicrobiia bacterium]|nr:heme ABC transporter ATP-binding protein [Acidimicrobiia bacterium]
MTRLAARDISYRVGRTTVLSEVAFDVESGELVAIVGPNGAGKTTLLRILGGDLEPTTGTVAIDENDVAGLHEQELALMRALLDQSGVADIPFPVETVVALGRTPHRRVAGNTAARDAEVVRRTMDDVGIGHLEQRVFATLSGGERALTSLARVLAQESPVLLLDEPTGALDVAVEERTMRLMRERATGGVMVVCVLHDLNLAARYADRVILVGAGEVISDGPPTSVLTPDALSAVYRHPMRVVPHPFRDGLLVLVD